MNIVMASAWSPFHDPWPSGDRSPPPTLRHESASDNVVTSVLWPSMILASEIVCGGLKL